MARRFRPFPESNARPPMRDLIPDVDTLAVMSAVAMLRHRGEAVTLDAIEAEVRAVSGRSPFTRPAPALQARADPWRGTGGRPSQRTGQVECGGLVPRHFLGLS